MSGRRVELGSAADAIIDSIVARGLSAVDGSREMIEAGFSVSPRTLLRRMHERAGSDLSKAKRLALASAVAPSLRGGVGRRRVVKTYDQSAVDASARTAEIPVMRETSLHDVSLGILRRLDIEFDVTDEARPKQIVCNRCGRAVRVPVKGRIPTVCPNGACVVCTTCSERISVPTARRQSQRGQAPTCVGCKKAANRQHQKRTRQCVECHGIADRRPMTAGRCRSCHKAKVLADNGPCPGLDNEPCGRMPSYEAVYRSNKKGRIWRCVTCAVRLACRAGKPGLCAGWDGVECGERAPPKAHRKWETAKRKGEPWRCGACLFKSRPVPQRVRNRNQHRTPSDCRACGLRLDVVASYCPNGCPCSMPKCKGFASRGNAPARAKRGAAPVCGDCWSPEFAAAFKRQSWAALSPEERARITEKKKAHWTPERREQARVKSLLCIGKSGNEAAE
jgi:hypothetical protein